jgi:hypothetical protein
MTTAQRIINLLDERGGFDWFWDSVSEEDKQEILDEITRIINEES